VNRGGSQNNAPTTFAEATLNTALWTVQVLWGVFFSLTGRRSWSTWPQLHPSPDEKAKHKNWVSEFAKDIEQSDKGAYVNFLGEADEAQVRAAYPGPTWDRLRQIKAKYDPTYLFCLNPDIRP
jgi:hypothetical protein